MSDRSSGETERWAETSGNESAKSIVLTSGWLLPLIVQHSFDGLVSTSSARERVDHVVLQISREMFLTTAELRWEPATCLDALGYH